MLKKLARAALHLVFFAFVVAIAGYWAVRIFTPAPTAAPPPLPPPPLRDPDPLAAARMFGKVESAQVAVASNITAMGAFSAGKDSSAVLVVDGKPPRVFLVGQEVVPGMRLKDIGAEVIVLETAGGSQEVRLPPRPTVATSGGPPPQGFTREGNTLTAPMSGAAPSPAPRPVMPTPPPPQPAPQMQPPPQMQPTPPPPPPPTTPAQS